MELKLSCPACYTELNNDQPNTLVCSNCNKVYPVVDNIPIVIHEEKSVYSIADYLPRSKAAATQTPSGLKSAIMKGIWFLQRAAPDPTLNVSAKNNHATFGRMLLEKGANPRVLIIGGRTLGAGMEDFIKLPITFVEADIAFGPNTKLICDAQYLPFKAEEFDGVIIQAVMEYLSDPYQCAAEIHRVLKPDGLIYSETPFMQQVHGGAHDFTRLTYLGHRRLYRNFEEEASGVCVGTGSALAMTYRHFLMSLTDKKAIGEILLLFAVWTSFWLKYFDWFTYKTRGTYDAASGFYFLGKKSTYVISDKEILKLYRGS